MNNKPVLVLSRHLTPITNRANAAMKLFDNHSHEAGKRVWDAPLDSWENIVREYAHIEYSSTYHSRWHPAQTPRRLTPPRHMGHTPVDRVKRFLGLA